MTASQVFKVNAQRTTHSYVGGMSIIMSPVFSVQQLFIHADNTFQLLVVQVECSLHCVIIAGLYRSPALSTADFTHDYVQPILCLHNSVHPVIIVGDFNVDARQSTVLFGVWNHTTRDEYNTH